MAARPPVPPFDRETAVVKVSLVRGRLQLPRPEQVALTYTADSWWRNRSELLVGRQAIIAFLTRKSELDYRLSKEQGHVQPGGGWWRGNLIPGYCEFLLAGQAPCSASRAAGARGSRSAARGRCPVSRRPPRRPAESISVIAGLCNYYRTPAENGQIAVEARKHTGAFLTC